VTVGDLKKFAEGLTAKLGESAMTKAIGEMTDKVEKSMASLADRVEKLENMPAASKAKASYVEITKGDEAGSDTDVDALLKRRDELVANPTSGTPAERIELAMALRKAQAAGAKLTA
jgi:hypothetical protein